MTINDIQNELGRDHSAERENMTKREAIKVAHIVQQAHGIRVTGFRHYGRGDWAIDAVDDITGYPIVVWSLEDWQQRRRNDGP